ncbi:MAG TPA: toll/interleukin-1 receptor domain-containing protein [Chthoniobacterales bacterium]|nr:toll/interleukin-1 receptor domain-containing protein [Chthoniobacterales bacterium]
MNRRTFAWDVFISHASEDKEQVARPLAEWLEHSYGLKVWFDELELKAGDSLRRSIDNGLANSKFGVVIISKSFMAKQWPQDELAALATREIAGKKVILPIWHDVTSAEVRNWSPLLADRVALNWTRTPHAMIKALVRAMDLPFSGNTLAGIWRGSTGRLRLIYDGDNYRTPLQFYDGDYDWNARNWSGQIRGAFSSSSRIFLFEWSWMQGPEHGVGFLELNARGDNLVGGWKIADDGLVFGGYRPTDYLSIDPSKFIEFSEFPLREFRGDCNAWAFSRLRLDDDIQ